MDLAVKTNDFFDLGEQGQLKESAKVGKQTNKAFESSEA